ncbi:GNAT family acetyltransferase [Algisphaera agarilytica]|uniref:GNAT family acetyltransferase n=1 Tax=Algisphaera agarilytica TaxID=1385975 RepID=UPI001C87ECE0|nr:GNAT family acetyltransferase [Algisphaera agarilytica]
MSRDCELILRTYVASDHDALVELWRRCGLVVPVNNPSRDIQLKLDRDPDGLVVGEVDTGECRQLVASVMVGYEGHRGWVNYLAVDPEYQRQGFGRVLVEHAEQWLRERGCPKLNLQVRSSNTRVIGFYEKLGYTQDAVVSLGKRF